MNIDYVEVEIGGQVVDKQYGHWMELWCDLSHSADQRKGLNACLKGAAHAAPGSAHEDSYVPLQFWFCRNPGLALPLIALQYHEVKLNVMFSGSALGLGAGSNVSLYCDYVFLDTDERRRFAQVSHEYLIEQVQYSNALSISGSGAQHELRFNHPVKELVWTNANDTADATCATALLQLNGHDRFKRREGKYFTTVQRYQHHSGAIGTAVAGEVGHGHVSHVYSFALKPEEHQPSGTCNFSRIDNAVLNLEFKSSVTTGTLKVYAVNYNVLRIMSGMGGLAYSN